jgi:hypothetical protein
MYYLITAERRKIKTMRAYIVILNLATKDWSLQYLAQWLHFKQINKRFPVLIGEMVCENDIHFAMYSITADSQYDAWRIAYESFGGQSLEVGDKVCHEYYGNGIVTESLIGHKLLITCENGEVKNAYKDGSKSTFSLTPKWQLIKE